MDFSLFLACFLPDAKRPAEDMYGEMIEMARAAEQSGFRGLTVPEHHFMNILMTPSPLMLAVKVAAETERIPITTAVVVLPLNDMLRLAGEIALADCLTGGRIQIGVGRGAFPYEFRRYGVSFEKSREIFDESLSVLQALLSEPEVSWDSEHYRFEPTTIMPRPVQKPHPPIWIAAMAPMALYHSAKRGFNIQTTPLQGSLEMAQEQVASFTKGAVEAPGPARPRLALLRMGFCTRDDAHTAEIITRSTQYWRRFDNVFTTEGSIHNGGIELIEIDETLEQLRQRLFVGTPEQLIEKLQPYADAGVDEINLNFCLSAPHAEVMESIERFAEHVIPHFAGAPLAVK